MDRRHAAGDLHRAGGRRPAPRPPRGRRAAAGVVPRGPEGRRRAHPPGALTGAGRLRTGRHRGRRARTATRQQRQQRQPRSHRTRRARAPRPRRGDRPPGSSDLLAHTRRPAVRGRVRAVVHRDRPGGPRRTAQRDRRRPHPAAGLDAKPVGTLGRRGPARSSGPFRPERLRRDRPADGARRDRAHRSGRDRRAGAPRAAGVADRDRHRARHRHGRGDHRSAGGSAMGRARFRPVGSSHCTAGPASTRPASRRWHCASRASREAGPTRVVRSRAGWRTAETMPSRGFCGWRPT